MLIDGKGQRFIAANCLLPPIDTLQSQTLEKFNSPAPQYYREAVMEQLDVKPEEVLYVGDSGVDMQTANNAGLTAVGVTWGFRDREDLIQNGADVLADEPAQILDMLDR